MARRIPFIKKELENHKNDEEASFKKQLPFGITEGAVDRNFISIDNS